ncbi:hypothetical protein EJ08DRAFT_697961 [Tothia fuscella]|uniref:Major facilitator superfamily (MFS) profile domain-containing protein n=1 Tax=Tothia fuscella TaxID=1048955 RepID=A0A9P4TYJ1_9PEZI|nr:hypothetical protein EJ08DRAFT_697961 [Tothia fuscella]
MEAPTKGTFRLAEREFPRVTWYTDKAMRKTYICLMFVVLTSATNGYDGSMVNGLQALTPFNDYFHPNKYQQGLLSCIMSVGSLVAIPFVPYAADILGRRMAIFIGCIIMILGVALQSASQNLSMFVAARFFIGYGVAIAHGASPLLITELVHPQHRSIFTTVYNTTWYFGSIIAAWLTFGTNRIPNNLAWRIPSIVQALPSVLQLIFVWTVPESPRWHISKGNHEVGLKILGDVHANGNLNDEVVQLEYDEIRDTIRLEQELESSNWSELWRTKGNRHRLVILLSAGLFSQLSGNALCSYLLTKVLDDIGIKDHTVQLTINGILQIVNFFTAVGMCFFVDRIGRRKLFLTSTSGMLVSFIVWTICAARQEATKAKGAGNAVVVMIFIYYLFYNMAWSGLLVGYTVEILPYSIRAKGMTVLFLMVDIALFFNQYVNPIALADIGWKYYIVFCVWLAIELVVVWKFYIETRNTPLEEIAKHFDGQDALVGGAAATGVARHEIVLSDMKNGVVSKSLPPAAKQALILQWIQKSGVAYSFKDLEKYVPQIASINGMQVKEYIQALTDENQIRVEKIGSGNWYWCFMSDEKIKKETALARAQEERDKASAAVEDLQAKVEEAGAAREEGDEEVEEGMDRKSLTTKNEDLTKEVEGLKVELASYSENDPVEVEKKKERIEEYKMEAEKWTEQIQSMEGWMKKNSVDKVTLKNMKKNMYGDEYDEEDGGLREL